VAVGRAVHRGDVFGLEIHLDGASVHALATSADEAHAHVLWRVDRADGDPGRSARRLASAAIASALGLDPADVRISRRPPVALHRGRPLELGLSLSHHGRFLAFACTRGDQR
jgi:hypothetical protein